MTGLAPFAGQTALLTGANAGSGHAVDERLAGEGARVILAARSPETGAVTDALGGDALFARCDLANPARVARLFDTITDRCGGIDLAVNNAGAEQDALPIDAIDAGEIDRLMAVNARAVWLCMAREIG